MMKSLDDMKVGDLVRYENDGETEDLILTKRLSPVDAWTGDVVDKDGKATGLTGWVTHNHLPYMTKIDRVTDTVGAEGDS